MPLEPRQKRTATIVAAVFLLALVMGPGPGSLLIAPHGSEPKFALGIPTLYLWLVFWFLVLAGCVLFSAAKLWSDGD